MLRVTTKLIVTALILFGGGTWANTAAAASPTPTSQQQILTIVVRDSHGQPLAGVTCEVLSNGWGNKSGQGITVIASGDTTQDGQVAFDVTKWPHSTYSVNFKSTDHLNPANTYFAPEYNKQSQAYAEAIFGGATETSYFVVGSDGRNYPDKAKGKGPPDYDTNAPGGDGGEGNVPPGFTPISGQAYLATAMAGTVRAVQFGTPNPTVPQPAAPTNNTPQGAILATTIFDLPAATSTSNTTSQAGAGAASSVMTQSNNTPPAPAPANNQEGGTLASTLFAGLLAVFGVTCLVLFLIFRAQIYRILFTFAGIQIYDKPRTPKRRRPAKNKAGKGKGKSGPLTVNKQQLPGQGVDPTKPEEE